QGRMWTSTVRRLSGRPVVVPASGELVALGAAALAAGAADGEDAVAVATRWETGAGVELEAVERDTETWERIASVLDRAAPGLLA
ncbi:xylulokinase, partial [Streptomyces fuscigenes]|nr:xylulokinase [Streptomyces fuscigenes]